MRASRGPSALPTPALAGATGVMKGACLPQCHATHVMLLEDPGRHAQHVERAAAANGPPHRISPLIKTRLAGLAARMCPAWAGVGGVPGLGPDGGSGAEDTLQQNLLSRPIPRAPTHTPPRGMGAAQAHTLDDKAQLTRVRRAHGTPARERPGGVG